VQLIDVFSAWNVAWYGAIVATLALAFNIWKASRERARLRIKVFPTYYEDGAVSKVEKTENGGEVQTLLLYFHIEIINVGERPTTIMGVGATTQISGLLERIHPLRRRFRGTMGFWGKAFDPHYRKTLPHVIDPGGVWSCRVPKRDIVNLRRGGIPKLQVTATCWPKPRLFPFPLQRNDEEVDG